MPETILSPGDPIQARCTKCKKNTDSIVISSAVTGRLSPRLLGIRIKTILSLRTSASTCLSFFASQLGQSTSPVNLAGQIGRSTQLVEER